MCVKFSIHGLVSRDLGLTYVWEGHSRHRMQKPIWITEWINIKIAIYAYDYCKINVKYKLSYQIRHFPSNQLTNTRCRWTMVVISQECCITIALICIYINCDCTKYMRWICVNGPWLSNFESSWFFPLEPLLKLQTSRLQQRHFFVYSCTRIEPVEWCEISRHRCRKHLELAGERLPPISWTQLLLLISIRLVAVQRVIERVPICLWIKSFSKYSMISLHC
jgi:hypothetical protein